MRSHRPQRVRQDLVVTLWVLLAVLAGTVAGAPAAVAAPLLPDVVSDPPVGDGAPDVEADAQGSRLLLRLDGFVHNRGPGPLEIRGSNPSDRVMGTVRQRVYDDSGGYEDVAHAPAPALVYETNDDHAHWHLLHAMRYSLWSHDRSVEVAPVQKVGFCLLDSERIEAPAHARRVYTEAAHDFCRWRAPAAARVFMGVSPGWRDVYGSGLAFQWVDVSDVAPGPYWLRADADPDGVIAETDEVNPSAYDSKASIINGYRADPVAAGTVPALGPTPIALAATKFDDVHSGSPGPREFQIVTPPAGGTLDRPTGTWFSGAQVRYTPKPGFSGADSFTVAARDASTPFPRSPPSAAVTLTVQGAAQGPVQAQPLGGSGGGTVQVQPLGGSDGGVLGISGARRSVYTSSTTQLHASGPGVAQGVTWSVQAGASRAGTISAGGVYRAPASVPSGGRVAISARSATGASGRVTIRVAAAPRRRSAPTVEAPPVPKRGLSKIRLGRHNRSLIAAVSSAHSGRVRFAMKRNGRRFGSCSMVVRKRGSATCTARIPSAVSRLNLVCLIPRTVDLKLRGVTVTATLTRHGRIVATRRASAR
jgi:Lysyl oxidase/Bacterial Ig domain